MAGKRSDRRSAGCPVETQLTDGPGISAYYSLDKRYGTSLDHSAV